MGGQHMGSTRGMFPVLTCWNALTPSLRATPLPRAGEGPGVREYSSLQRRKFTQPSNVLSAVVSGGAGGSAARQKSPEPSAEQHEDRYFHRDFSA
jgi:hypothetical protein